MKTSDFNPLKQQQVDMHFAKMPSNYVRMIAQELGLTLKEIPKLLRFTSVSAIQFTQEDVLFSVTEHIQVLINALSLTNQQDFSFRLGKRLTPLTHGAMGFLAHSSPNLLLALQAFHTFLPTRMSFAKLDLTPQPQYLQCRLEFMIELPLHLRRVLSESCALILYAFAEFILGRPMYEAKIYFDYAEPEYSHYYADYMVSEYHFDAPYLQIDIPLSLLEIPNASANQDNYLLAKSQCELLLKQLQADPKNYIYQIQKIMLSYPLTEITEDFIAAHLFMSKRTLARKLQKNGSSFRQIKDEVLAKQASHFLQHSALTIEAIATLLNYHDSANFRRAFKRWFNTSPSEYRLQHK